MGRREGEGGGRERERDKAKFMLMQAPAIKWSPIAAGRCIVTESIGTRALRRRRKRRREMKEKH